MNIQLDNTSVIDVDGYRDDTTHGCVFVSVRVLHNVYAMHVCVCVFVVLTKWG